MFETQDSIQFKNDSTEKKSNKGTKSMKESDSWKRENKNQEQEQ